MRYKQLRRLRYLHNLQHLQLKLTQRFISTEAPPFARREIPWRELAPRLKSLVLHTRLPDMRYQFPVLTTLYVWGLTAGCSRASLQHFPALRELAIFEKPNTEFLDALKQEGTQAHCDLKIEHKKVLSAA